MLIFGFQLHISFGIIGREVHMKLCYQGRLFHTRKSEGDHVIDNSIFVIMTPSMIMILKTMTRVLKEQGAQSNTS